jgi:pimeloyl-ACP methyl ester carboxylesterase
MTDAAAPTSDEPIAAADRAAPPGFIPRAQAQQLFAELGKIVAPQGIDTAEHVVLGGARQWVTVRSHDPARPILLYLHGGPGGALADMAFAFARPWEDYFTVVQWDQRGFGRSGIDGPQLKGTLNKDQLIADTIELIELLRLRLGHSKVIVLGQSWGSQLGIEVAKRRPELLHALVAMGQQVSVEGAFEHTRQLLIGLSREQGDRALEEQMQAAGPVPSARNEWAAFLRWIFNVQGAMSARGFSWRNARGPAGWAARFAAMRLLSPSLGADEAGPRSAQSQAELEAAQSEIIGSTSGWDIYRDVGTVLKVPYIAIMGRYDWQTPVDLAKRYYDAVQAPWKVWNEFPESAHVVLLEEPGRLIVTLHQYALAAAQGRIPEGVTRFPGAEA